MCSTGVEEPRTARGEGTCAPKTWLLSGVISWGHAMAKDGSYSTACVLHAERKQKGKLNMHYSVFQSHRKVSGRKGVFKTDVWINHFEEH